MLVDPSDHHYQRFFCEENIWHLNHYFLENTNLATRVLFFINSNQSVLMQDQKSFKFNSLGCWDYHVVLELDEEERIFDFDSRLGFEIQSRDYFLNSFPDQSLIDSRFRLTIRSIDGLVFDRMFWTDRSHMLDERGRFIADPPAWKPVQGLEPNLRLVDLIQSRFKSSFLTDLSLAEYLECNGGEA